MAELEVFAGARGVLRRAQRPLHLLDLQLQGVERAEDLLHAVRIVHVLLALCVVHQLAGVDVPPGPGRLDWQGLDDLARGALGVEEGSGGWGRAGPTARAAAAGTCPSQHGLLPFPMSLEHSTRPCRPCPVLPDPCPTHACVHTHACIHTCSHRGRWVCTHTHVCVLTLLLFPTRLPRPRCPGLTCVQGQAPPHHTSHTVQNVLGSNHTNILPTILSALGDPPPNSRVLRGYSLVGQGVLAGLPHPSGQLDPAEKEKRISHGH